MEEQFKNKKSPQKRGKRRKRNKIKKWIEMLSIALIAISSIISTLGMILLAKDMQSQPEPQRIIVEIEKIEIHVEMEAEKAIDKPVPMAVKPTVSHHGPSDSYYYQITEAEKELLAKLVYQEARGEALEGKVAVVATVFNRLYYTGDEYRFDNDSIESIIKEGYASIKDVTIEMLDTVPECMEAVELACRGWDPTRCLFPEGAKFFYAPNSDLISEEELRKREGVKSLVMDNHVFHDELKIF